VTSEVYGWRILAVFVNITEIGLLWSLDPCGSLKVDEQRAVV